MSKLSTLLKEYREIKGWTQAELAERAGVPYQTVSRYEGPSWKGTANPANVIRLAEHLCIPDEKWLAALDIPLKHLGSAQERDDQFAEIAALAQSDARFESVAAMWKDAGDDEKDAALSVLRTIFKKEQKPVRRRRLRPDQ